jgi:hypothetical protein
VQRVEGAAFGAGIEPAAKEQEAEDEQHGVVVDVGLESITEEEAGREGGRERIGEGCAGTEGDERVHVGAAVAGGGPGGAVDDAAAPDHAGQRHGEHCEFERAR